MKRSAFQIVSRGALAWLACDALRPFPWLLHAFSTRRGGVSRPPARGLNLGFIPTDLRANVEKNRKRFFRRLGAEDFSLAGLRQTHSTRIYHVTRETSGELQYHPPGSPFPPPSEVSPPVGDALLTNQPGVLLSVRVADCLPILLVDPRHRAIAALHAGWRGALERIVEKSVGALRAVFGSDPRRMLAAVGPGIHGCCYEVGEEVVAAFCGRFLSGEQFFSPAPAQNPAHALSARFPLLFLSQQPPSHRPHQVPAAHLDLVAVAQDQLRSAGLRPSNIRVVDLCTACRTDLFFSHRKEGSGTGRMMAVIGIRPSRRRRARQS